MAFAQLTYRESLRDIEACLRRKRPSSITWDPRSVARSNLADANERARLAHLLRVRAALITIARKLYADEPLRRGTGQHRLCAGLHHHRSVPVAVPVGAVSLDQGGDQAAYAARSARRNSQLYPHLRRQDARRQRAGSAASRSRRFLRDGPRISGFRATLSLASGGRLLRHPRQAQHECATPAIRDRGSQHGTDLRSERRAHGFYAAQDYPGAAASHPLQGSRRPARGWCS